MSDIANNNDDAEVKAEATTEVETTDAEATT